ncbi:MAG: SigE family RNA polymerase sigma factor [Acidimicrobiales bacterium]|nr:SigE family RNA polymerase sigma factor [Acidimicrobiales bacterium]
MAASSDRPTVDAWLVDLYRSEYAHLVRLATLLVDDVGEAEELVQDAFVAAARTRQGSFQDAGSAPAYLRSAVLNRARSRLRTRRVRRRHLRSVDPPPSAPGADRQALASEETRRMLAVLGRLPARQREVLVLRYYLELSEAEIADELGISAGSVKTHAHRGLAALESQLEAP